MDCGIRDDLSGLGSAVRTRETIHIRELQANCATPVFYSDFARHTTKARVAIR